MKFPVLSDNNDGDRRLDAQRRSFEELAFYFDGVRIVVVCWVPNLETHDPTIDHGCSQHGFADFVRCDAEGGGFFAISFSRRSSSLAFISAFFLGGNLAKSVFLSFSSRSTYFPFPLFLPPFPLFFPPFPLPPIPPFLWPLHLSMVYLLVILCVSIKFPIVYHNM